MSEPDVKILIVDDLREKLLVYQSVLEEPGVELITAKSGLEALRQVLHHEFAVILLDVNMPDMDGFETASLIRRRKRCAHTPIIFITAQADEMHALKGYSHGAVDYILSPIVPTILRTKVRVFVELFRLNQKVRQQAALAEQERARLTAVLESAPDFVGRTDVHGHFLHVNRAGRRMLGLSADGPVPDTLTEFSRSSDPNENWQQDALRAATKDGVWFGETTLHNRHGQTIPVSQVILSHKSADGEVDSFSVIARDISERRQADRTRSLLASIVDSSDDAIISKNLQGVITTCNRAAERLFGYPASELVGQSVLKLIPPERVDEEQMILSSIAQGKSIEHYETIRIRKDGARIDVSLTVSPVRDHEGRVVGASKIARDVTAEKAVERAVRENEGRLRVMFGQAAVGIVLFDPQGRFLEVNDRMCQIVGRTREELCAMSGEDLIHPDDRSCHHSLMERAAAGDRPEFAVEERYRRGDGSWVWIKSTVSSLTDENNRVHRMMAVIEDISDRKQAEQEIQRHREHLEQLVIARTAELKASLERLRLSDRLASVGTLAAGLGHDMGNLLLPVRLRLDALDQLNLPPTAREHVQAIATCSEYLRRLSQGLRLFALDPEEEDLTDETTVPASWWLDVEPLLRNTLPRGIILQASLASDLPPLAMPSHRLTQAIFNLVQNAGDAMRSRGHGEVRLSADITNDRQHIDITVADDGPGMTDELRQRCMEPFFTTKTRGISTGLGLSLVHGVVSKAGGSIDIHSTPGQGTSFRLRIPIHRPLAVQEVSGNGQTEPTPAVVRFSDPRLTAYVTSVLRSMEYEVRNGSHSDYSDVELLVTDGVGGVASEIQQFLTDNPIRRAVVFGAWVSDVNPTQVTCLPATQSPAKIRQSLQTLLKPEPAASEATTATQDAVTELST